MVSPTAARRISYDVQCPTPFVPVLWVSLAVLDDCIVGEVVVAGVDVHYWYQSLVLVASSVPVYSYIRIPMVDGVVVEIVAVDGGDFDDHIDTNDFDVAVAIASQKFCSYHHILHHSSNNH